MDTFDCQAFSISIMFPYYIYILEFRVEYWGQTRDAHRTSLSGGRIAGSWRKTPSLLLTNFGPYFLCALFS